MNPESKPFSILAVCTGNICRSTTAEIALQGGLEKIHPQQFRVTSAGSRALVGHPPERRVAASLAALQLDASSFSSRQLNEDQIVGADLILALTREHRSAVVSLVPSALRRTFTLRELARILPLLPDFPESGAELWRRAMPRAIRLRSAAPGGTPENDDVVDPYRRPDDVHERMMAELLPAVQTIIAWSASSDR